MTTLEYFRLFANEFSAMSDAIVNTWIGIAENLVNTNGLDDERAKMATALYTAHLIAIASRASAGNGLVSGALQSEREGDLSRSYVAVKGSDTWLGQSAYGMQYLDIIRAVYGMGIMTR